MALMYVAGCSYTESSCNKRVQEFTVTKAATWTLAYMLLLDYINANGNKEFIQRLMVLSLLLQLLFTSALLFIQ